MFIPKLETTVEKRKIAYKVLWQTKSVQKEIDLTELDDSEIEDIKEFELNIIKGNDNISELFFNVKEVIEFFDNLSLGRCEWKKIISFYVNKDNSLDRKSEENYYVLKNKL